MGFFLEVPTVTAATKSKYSIDFLRRQACNVCPLNTQIGLKHPHMEPTGSKNPVIYILGEAPGADEDSKGIQFVGTAGRTLRSRIPEKWIDKIRFNNCVRTRPPDNRTPTSVELECCRNSIVKDIEETKPIAIFGMGNIPLWWAGISQSDSGITNWNGRRVPVKIGKHSCWFFPMMHPSFINRSRGQKRGPDLEFTFDLDLKNAFSEIENGLPEPIVHSVDDALSGLEIVKDYKRAIKLIKSMMFDPLVGLDLETSAHHAGKITARPYAKDAKILTIGMSNQDYSFSFPLYHKENKWTEEQILEVEDTFVRFLLKSSGRKVVHYLAFEMEWLAYFYGEEILRPVKGSWGCSNAQAYVLDERIGTHSLDFLTMQYFGINIKSIDNLNREKLDQAPLDLVLRYNALDAKYHRLLYIEQDNKIKDEKLTKVYDHHLRRVPTMTLTQLKGIPVDQAVVEQFNDKYSKLLDDIELDIADLSVVKKYREAKRKPFNPASNNDVKWLVNNILKVSIDNTDEGTLEKIDHPFIKLILEYRGVAKIYSTYIKPCMKGSPVLWPDGLAHPIISITTTRTGRTSSTDPNCFPEYVEALTEYGWMRWSEIRKSDRLAQYDFLTKEIDFSIPLALHKEEYTGTLINLKTDLHFDMVTTPNHRYGLLSQKKNKLFSKRADNFGENYKLVQAGYFKSGKQNLRQSQIILIAAFQADAYLSKKHSYIEWKLTYERKQICLRKALHDEHIKHNERMEKSGKKIRFYVPRKEVPEWLSSRRHYGPWILSLDENTLRLLAEELWLWDGSSTTNNDFCTGNQTDADWVQILLTIIGKKAVIRKRQSTSTNTLFVTTSNKDYCYTTNFESITLPSNGYVYCATMPKGTLIVRHNGKVCITENSQNWPKHAETESEGEDGGKLKEVEVRRQIHPGADLRIVTCDYSGIQARNVAMESRDEKLVKAFWENYDIHADWRDRIARKYPPWEKGKDPKALRQIAKNLFVFPTLFGAQASSTSGNLGIPKNISEELREEFFSEFPDILKWHLRLVTNYKKTGYVTGLSGFRRHAPISGTELINSPIQADETMIVCDAMIRLSQIVDAERIIGDRSFIKRRFQPNGMVHDDLWFIWPKKDIERNLEIVAKEMTRVSFPWINVPLSIEASMGENWCNIVDIGKYSSVELWKHKRGGS